MVQERMIAETSISIIEDPINHATLGRAAQIIETGDFTVETLSPADTFPIQTIGAEEVKLIFLRTGLKILLTMNRRGIDGSSNKSLLAMECLFQHNHRGQTAD